MASVKTYNRKRDGQLANLGPPTPEELDHEFLTRATDKASEDPIIRLVIEDLHERLSLAHREAAALHEQRATDAGTIAALTERIADQEANLTECEEELKTYRADNRALKGRLQEIREELDSTRKRLQICLERGWQPGGQE